MRENLLPVSYTHLDVYKRQEKDGVGGRISVTDATMNPDLKEIIVTYNGKRIPIQMPQGAFCGKTVTVNL